MLARLDMKLDSKVKLSYSMSSIFHGALMDIIDKEYASELHKKRLNPYSQHLELRDKEWHWIVCTTEEEAYRRIIEVLLNIDNIFIKKKDANIIISEKVLIKKKIDDIENIFADRRNNLINIRFLTPTCFKQSGEYIFMPDLRCIFQSLMNKYDSVCQCTCLADVEILDEISSNCRIKKYNIRTTNFYMEKIKITGMVGDIQIEVKNSNTMANFLSILFRFGEFSGIGAKCSLGMGAIQLM